MGAENIFLSKAQTMPRHEEPYELRDTKDLYAYLLLHDNRRICACNSGTQSGTRSETHDTY